MLSKFVKEFLGSEGDDGAGSEDGGDAFAIEGVVVLGGDDATDHDQDIVASVGFEGFAQLRYESEVSGSKAAYADDVDIVFDGLTGAFLGGLEEGSDIDIKAEIGKSGGDHLLAAIMAVLSHLGDQDTRSSSFGLGEAIGELAGGFDGGRLVADLAAVDARDGLDWGLVAAKDFFEGIADLADRCVCADGFDGQSKEVSAAILGATSEGLKGGLEAEGIALCAQLVQAFDLGLTDGGVIDLKDIEVGFFVERKAIDTDDALASAVDTGLGFGGGFFDAHLGDSRGDGFGHATERLDLLDVFPSA